MLRESTVALLRSLISEVLKVTLEPVDPANPNKPGTPEVRVFENEDDIDELMYQLGRFDFRPLKYDEEMKKKKRKVLTPESAKDLETIVYTLARKGENERLMDVIKPWGQVGYEALLKILTATLRHDKEFPFFESADDVAVGRTIPFPDKPTRKVIADVLQMKTRVGKSDTGKGELLFALMTGGVPPDEDVGDIVIGDSHWEVKDVRQAPIIRLGGVHSQAFMAAVEGWAKESKTDVDKVKKLIRSAKNVGDVVWPQMTVLLQQVLSTTQPTLDGIVLVKDAGFQVLGTQVAVFHSVSNEGRVHFTVDEAVADQQVAAAEKARQAAADAAEAAAGDKA